jgi:hypothetical protein
MANFTIWHWLCLFLVLSIYIVPVWRVLSKAGYSGAWSILSFVPILNIVMLWVFAFTTWPRDRK